MADGVSRPHPQVFVSGLTPTEYLVGIEAVAVVPLEP
jgi:hypothetical protein